MWILEENSSSEMKNKNRQFKRKFDSFDKDVIARKMNTFFSNGEFVTLRKLKASLEEEHGLRMSKTQLWRFVRALGFSFKNSNGNRKVLCERNDLQIARCHYLRTLKRMREADYAIVYLDETWISAHHTFKKEWKSNDEMVARKIPTGRGQRLILLHAIDAQIGFIPGCQLLFKSISTDGRDFHTEMNSTIFEDWLENTLLPTLNAPSCIVMDNAS